MILLTVLFFILVMLIAFAVTCLSIGGTLFTIIFADVIVCIFIVACIIRSIIRKRR